MALTVMATSTDDVYTTTAYVKALMGTTATSDDATISALIRVASRWADGFVGFPLSAAKWRETVPTFDSRRLMLARTPLRAVPALWDATDTDDADQIQTSEFRVESREAGFLSRDIGWEWTAPIEGEMTQRPRSGQEFKPWLVDYVAGYSYGGVDTGSSLWSTVHGTTSTARTLPEDVEHAVALRAQALFDGSDDVTEEQLGDLRVNYRSGARDAAVANVTTYEAILEPYRRMV